MTNSKRPRVLVADDDEAIRILVARMLRRSGFDTTEVSDGKDAIEKLRDETFDAVLLDLMMPCVDGFGVVEYIVADLPLMMEKTIVMTAFPKAAVEGRLHHLCDIISKPFDMVELVEAVRTCAGR